MAQEFFIQRPSVTPTIYVYNLPQVPTHTGFVKVGYTDRDAKTRIDEQMHTSGLNANILYTSSAMRSDGSIFTDKDVHRILRNRGFRQMNEGSDRNEWFNCTVADVKAVILELKSGIITNSSRTANFKMRPEQEVAVERTIEYFKNALKEDPNRSPKFLWNAKMRFGKTFAAYQLARKMEFKRILVLTFKPAVESAWREDLMTHVDFSGWQFIANKDAYGNHVSIDEEYARADKERPIVVFGSFQDLLGTNDSGGIKAKNEFIHSDNWDLVIFDEYHFGAWRENAKKLFDDPDDEENADFDIEKYGTEEAGNAYNETFLPITTDYYLFLSGTPFRAINSGEFIEDQIYNWTYSDEQRAKMNWVGKDNPNERTLDLATYMKEHPYMYSSENVRVKFRINRAMISDIIDTFGTDVVFSDETDSHITVSTYTNKMAMGQFAKSYSPDVEILEPLSLRKNLIDNLKRSLECYKKGN